jgi:hypothetical protein
MVAELLTSGLEKSIWYVEPGQKMGEVNTNE